MNQKLTENLRIAASSHILDSKLTLFNFEPEVSPTPRFARHAPDRLLSGAFWPAVAYHTSKNNHY